jgi:hypothetical protein
MILCNFHEVLVLKNKVYRNLLSYSKDFHKLVNYELEGIRSLYITTEDFYSYLLRYEGTKIEDNHKLSFEIIVSGLLL